MTHTVKSLHIYPVKSCRGQDVDQLDLEPMGPVGDRRAMIVNGQGQFLTQRTHGRLAQIRAHQFNDDLILSFDDNDIEVQWSSQRIDGTVWNDRIDLRRAQKYVSDRLSDFLDEDVSLVSMDDLSKRRTSGTWADSDVSLADGYPILVTNTASLLALSNLSGIDISMRQFRPNIVVDGTSPWAEDQWGILKIGEVEIELVKPCTRCQVTTLDPLTGEQAFPETMATMIKHRKSAEKRISGVLFGQNAIIRKTGKIVLGDPVDVISKREAWPIK